MNKKLVFLVLFVFVSTISVVLNSCNSESTTKESSKSETIAKANKLFEISIEIVNSIKDKSSKVEGYSNIASELANAGKFDRAENLCDKVIEIDRDEIFKSKAYCDVLAKAGKFDKSIEIAKSIK